MLSDEALEFCAGNAERIAHPEVLAGLAVAGEVHDFDPGRGALSARCHVAPVELAGRPLGDVPVAAAPPAVVTKLEAVRAEAIVGIDLLSRQGTTPIDYDGPPLAGARPPRPPEP